MSACSVLCFLTLACHMSRSEQLRQLAAQLSSLATLEDAVAHGVQNLLDVAFGVCGSASRRGSCPCALLRHRSRSCSPLPKAAPNRPRGSILLSQRGLTGLSVKSCPAAPPDRSVSSHRCSGSSASAAGLVEPRARPAQAVPQPRSVRASRRGC